MHAVPDLRAPGTIVVGMEATGCLWEPLYEALTQAGYTVLVLNPRQTASWAQSLGLRAKTDGIDAQTLARGLLAGYARASTLPSETVQELRTLTRARRDLVQSRAAAKQRLRDELVVLFPELPDQTPEQCDLMAPAMLQLLVTYSSAQAVAHAPLEDLTARMSQVSAGRWTQPQAEALQRLAQHSAASRRAVAARGLVVRTMARHLLDLQQHLAELEHAIAAALAQDEEGQRLQTLSGIGPLLAATMRAERGDVTRFEGVGHAVAYAGLELGSAHGAEWGVRRPEASLQTGTWDLAARALSGRARGRCAVARSGARYQRLLDRGHPKKEALTILSRALLKVVYHLLRTGTSYDPAALTAPKPGPARGRA